MLAGPFLNILSQPNVRGAEFAYGVGEAFGDDDLAAA